jgi:signal transduction histidine kinase
VGFDQLHAVGPQQGHFGLLGMSERAKRLGGRVVVESAPGTGVIVRAEIPVDLPPEIQPLSPN